MAALSFSGSLANAMLQFDLTAVWAFTTFLIFVVLTRVLYTAYCTPLSRVPGPWYAPFTNIPLKIAVLGGRRAFHVHNLHSRYGSVVRISPNELAICDTEGFNKIHAGRQGFPKNSWYQRITGDSILAIFTMRDPKVHAERRRILSKGFSKSSLRSSWEGEIRDMVNIAIDGMHQDALHDPTRAVDVSKWFTLLATDIAGRVMFGDSFGMLQAGKKTEYCELVEKATLASALREEIPFIRILAACLPIKLFKDVTASIPLMNEYGRRAVVNTRAALTLYSKQMTIFSGMVVGQEKEPGSLTDADIATEARNLTIAASDTTATALTYFVWDVIRRPQLQAALERELSTLQGEELTDEVLEHLPLFNATFLEVLRLHGSAASSLPRDVPNGGAVFDGFAVPEGTIVHTQAYTMHRRPEVWGVDADEFKIERWLNESGTSIRTGIEHSTYSPFGTGVRACIGIHLAWMEMRHAGAAFLLRCAQAQIAPEMHEDEMDMEDYFTMKPKGRRCMVSLSG
ncbi:hypothetical protein FH972_025552 [Carpinus fangiana]|uniref:Cytochrome P450 n=1 Tax=Carpinus fangiana TaxID=176857 RepID=A0A5N6L1R6_9ROSI|nr:hypothetical protein FH972_025552 [Carpinus fangiana]